MPGGWWANRPPYEAANDRHFLGADHNVSVEKMDSNPASQWEKGSSGKARSIIRSRKSARALIASNAGSLRSASTLP